MFGIGLPEMILILALALIVVGPDKLPDLARSLAKGILELKKTAEGLKANFAEEGNPLNDIRPELEDAAKSLKINLLDSPNPDWQQVTSSAGVNPEVQATSVGTIKDVDAEFTAVSPSPPALDSEPEKSIAPIQTATDPKTPEISQTDTDHGQQ